MQARDWGLVLHVRDPLLGKEKGVERKNKLMLVAAIGAVAILVASSAVRCAAMRAADDGGGQQQAEIEQGARTEQGETEAPDDAAAAVMAVLESHAWQADGDASKTIAFKDGRFVESDGKNTRVTACDVTGAGDGSLDVALTRDGDGRKQTVIALSGEEGSYRVSSDGFAMSGTYVQGSGAKDPVAVSGLADPYIELISGKRDELASTIAAYCRDNVPTAKKATFDGEVYLDTNTGRTVATFHCDDTAATILSVEYSDGEFSVSG